MAERYFSFATEAGANNANGWLWAMMRLGMIGLGLWRQGSGEDDALDYVAKPDGSAVGDPSSEPISAWLAPEQVGGRWLIKSPRNYLAGEVAAVGGVDAGFTPSASNLVGGKLNGATISNTDLFFDSAPAVRPGQVVLEVGADLSFIKAGRPISMAQFATHLERKMISRNRHVSGTKDEAVMTEARLAAAGPAA